MQRCQWIDNLPIFSQQDHAIFHFKESKSLSLQVTQGMQRRVLGTKCMRDGQTDGSTMCLDDVLSERSGSHLSSKHSTMMRTSFCSHVMAHL